MKRFLPSSLLGQVMTVLAVGLLVAQAVSAVLLFQASEKRRETAAVSAVAIRIIAENNRAQGSDQQLREDRRRRSNSRRSEGFRPRPGAGNRPLARRLRLGAEFTESAPIQPDEERLASYEATLRDMLAQQDIVIGEIAITKRRAGDDPYVIKLIDNLPAMPPPDWSDRAILVAAVEQPARSGWITVRQPHDRPRTGGLATIILQTLVIFTVLVLLLYLVLRRITRPLARLTDRVSDFSRQPDRVVLLEERGPSDTRRLIAAHNAMETRIAALLDEKDVMLGAIGHDLKTPLAALRVRIESVPDEVQRRKMADGIEDITATLDDILTLSRVGRDRSGAEAVDLTELAIGIAEEFEDLGEPVAMAQPVQDQPRLVAEVQVTWIKRALRNLVSNAVRYGEAAHVSVVKEGELAILRVDDKGPGIAPDRIADMMEPFTRGEASRNRATGGAGLGLALARAIAQQHGGDLVLQNREEGGLRAELRLPL